MSDSLDPAILLSGLGELYGSLPAVGIDLVRERFDEFTRNSDMLRSVPLVNGDEPNFRFVPELGDA